MPSPDSPAQPRPPKAVAPVPTASFRPPAVLRYLIFGMIAVALGMTLLVGAMGRIQFLDLVPSSQKVKPTADPFAPFIPGVIVGPLVQGDGSSRGSVGQPQELGPRNTSPQLQPTPDSSSTPSSGSATPSSDTKTPAGTPSKSAVPGGQKAPPPLPDSDATTQPAQS